MKTIGLLPASGKASRIGGLPKFALPISDDLNLLSLHVKNLLEVCDEVRVSTQEKWIPLIEQMNLPINLVKKEPSTLSDAILHLANRDQDRMIFSMPDTYFVARGTPIYKGIFDQPGDIILGLFHCPQNLRGLVGQVEISDSLVSNVLDKSRACEYELMWGFIGFREGMINRITTNSDTPSTQINSWIEDGEKIGYLKVDADYIDVGSFQGIKQLYARL